MDTFSWRTQNRLLRICVSRRGGECLQITAGAKTPSPTCDLLQWAAAKSLRRHSHSRFFFLSSVLGFRGEQAGQEARMVVRGKGRGSVICCEDAIVERLFSGLRTTRLER